MHNLFYYTIALSLLLFENKKTFLVCFIFLFPFVLFYHGTNNILNYSGATKHSDISSQEDEDALQKEKASILNRIKKKLHIKKDEAGDDTSPKGERRGTIPAGKKSL